MQLVHQRDVHEPIGVLQQLRAFRDLGRRDGDDGLDQPLPHRLRAREGGRVGCGQQPGHRARGASVAGILPLRRDGEEDIVPDPRAVPFQRLPAHAVRGTWLAGGDEADQRAGRQPRPAGLERRAHRPEIRPAGPVERRRHAEQPGRGARQDRRIGGRSEAAYGPGAPPGGGGAVRRGGIDVAARHLEAGGGGFQRERQADMAEAEHDQPLG